MGQSTEVFVGVDVAKACNAVAIADGERGGEVRYLGDIDASAESMRRFVKRLASKYDRVHFCYEPGPTSYGLHRLIPSLGHPCTVVAPSLIPRKPGDRIKTNRRDAVALAKLLRAGELTAVWVPDEGHEACATWSAPARRRLKACGCIASRSAPSCSNMGASTRAKGMDHALPALAAGVDLRLSRSPDRPIGDGRRRAAC